MITLAWGLIKTFGPYLLIGMLILGVYLAGGYAVQRKWDLREAQLQAESKVIVDAAQKKADDFKKTTAEAAKIIGEIYDQNEKDINVLHDTNAQLLANRMRSAPTRRRSDCVSRNTGTTATGAQVASDYWELSKADSESIIAESFRADQIVEDARVMQGYIKSLRPTHE
jgi:hypothetical protein